MKTDSFLKEYVRRLSDEDLRLLSSRFSQNLCDDKAEVADFLSRSGDVDKWLRGASSSSEFFEMMDEIETVVIAENDRRSQTKEEKKPRRYSKLQVNGNTTV